MVIFAVSARLAQDMKADLISSYTSGSAFVSSQSYIFSTYKHCGRTDITVLLTWLEWFSQSNIIKEILKPNISCGKMSLTFYQGSPKNNN